MTPVMRLPALVAALVLLSCDLARAGAVSDTAGLLRALNQAPPNSTILLTPGTYSGVTISGHHGAVTITSVDRTHPARLTALDIDRSSGIILDGVELDASTTPINSLGGENTVPFQVTRSSNITLTHLSVHGDPAWTYLDARSGMMIRDSDHVTLANSDFHHLYNAVNQLDNRYLTISGVSCHDNSDDCIRGGGSSNVLIENTHCWSNHPDAADTDHPDCIQFWMSGETVADHDITIRGTRYERGTGGPTQAVFMRDETGHLPYTNVFVTDSVIQGGQYNGLSVNDVIGPDVERNTVCQYPDAQSWLIIRNSPGAKLVGNTAPTFKIIEGSTGVTEVGDKIGGACAPASNRNGKK